MGKRKQLSLNSLFPEVHPKTIFEHFTFKVLEKQIFPSFQVLFMHRCTVEPHTWSYLVNIKIKNMQIRYKGISIRIHDFVGELDTNICIIECKNRLRKHMFYIVWYWLKNHFEMEQGFLKTPIFMTLLYLFLFTALNINARVQRNFFQYRRLYIYTPSTIHQHNIE